MTNNLFPTGLFNEENMPPFQGLWNYKPFYDGLYPSLLDVTLSGLSKEEIHKPK
ncbi:hypothetical protein [uncultured Cyclobacterium sp.]|uniref:hypothetical protein n=1 Tax=uncultured Cyclobacterium sp. TaxID=453820 RepID=UPI0030EC8E4F|tara:strand:+ start:113953 stop:114114 length:162 start_codon:yes stop_codon:yes gene_type:complete